MKKNNLEGQGEGHQCLVQRWQVSLPVIKRVTYYPGQGSRESYTARLTVLRALLNLNEWLAGGRRRRERSIKGNEGDGI